MDGRHARGGRAAGLRGRSCVSRNHSMIVEDAHHHGPRKADTTRPHSHTRPHNLKPSPAPALPPPSQAAHRLSSPMIGHPCPPL
jgi:hypothetical protein